MSLYDNLIAAGLPIESATEQGIVTSIPGSPMTIAQIQSLSKIIFAYLNPTEYQSYSDNRTLIDRVKTEYDDTIIQLQVIIDATSPSNAQVVAAVKYLAKTVLLILKVIAYQYKHGNGNTLK